MSATKVEYSRVEQFGDDWYGRTETRGAITTTFDMTEVEGLEEHFHRVSVPQIEPGYVRDVAEYNLSPDGRELRFHTIDVELRPTAGAAAPIIVK